MTQETWVSNLFGLIITVLCGYLFFSWSRTFKRMSYNVTHTLIIASEKNIIPSEVNVTYNGVPISDLKRCVILIWNSGKETIRSEDKIDLDIFRIEMPLGRVRLLRSQIVRSSKKSVAAYVAGEQPALELSFRYLEPRQGFEVELLYEGESEAITLDGTFIGCRNGLDSVGQVQNVKLISLQVIMLLGFCAVTSVVLLKPVWTTFLLKTAFWPVMIPLVFASWLIDKPLQHYLRKMLRRLPPSDLADFMPKVNFKS